VSGAVVIGEDGRPRCPWGAGTDAMMRDYHDTEWGVPIHDEVGLYERICLEGFQSGLSWRTILAKRPAFRRAFHGFDPDRVARFGDRDVERLLSDAGIVRSRAKIEAAIANARAVAALREGDGLERLIWSHQPRRPRTPRTSADLPTQTPQSVALAKALRSHGFRFVGPTTVYALMEAAGLVNDHLQRCAFR
jgi:DNA-3-methyladenine glycosylase I